MKRDPKPSLKKELSFYESKKDEWLKSHEGQFVLICENNAAGFFPTYEKALEVGLTRFGMKSEFLIKQVVEQEPVYVIY